MFVAGVALTFGSRRGSRTVRRKLPVSRRWPVVSTISSWIAASPPTLSAVKLETSRTRRRGANNDLNQFSSPTATSPGLAATCPCVWPGCSGPRMHHLRSSGLVAPHVAYVGTVAAYTAQCSATAKHRGISGWLRIRRAGTSGSEAECWSLSIRPFAGNPALPKPRWSADRRAARRWPGIVPGYARTGLVASGWRQKTGRSSVRR